MRATLLSTSLNEVRRPQALSFGVLVWHWCPLGCRTRWQHAFCLAPASCQPAASLSSPPADIGSGFASSSSRGGLRAYATNLPHQTRSRLDGLAVWNLSMSGDALALETRPAMEGSSATSRASSGRASGLLSSSASGTRRERLVRSGVRARAGWEVVGAHVGLQAVRLMGRRAHQCVEQEERAGCSDGRAGGRGS